MRLVAMKSALSSKVVDNNLMVVDNLTMDAPRTKTIVAMLKNMEAKKALIVTAESDLNAYKSARNIEGVSIIPCNNINVYDIIKYEKLILTADAAKKLEEVYA
jgi:large subunit ribosomal protein L4